MLTLGGTALCPLLEFDEYGVIPATGVPPTEKAVQTAGGERDLVLEQNPVISQSAMLEGECGRPQRVCPRRDLGTARQVPHLAQKGVLQLPGNLVLNGVLDELG